MKNEKVLHTVKEEKNILHTMNRRKTNSIGHILHRNCLLQHGTEGKTISCIGTAFYSTVLKERLLSFLQYRGSGR